MRSPDKFLFAVLMTLTVSAAWCPARRGPANSGRCKSLPQSPQQNVPSTSKFDQFPSFGQLTTTDKDGTQTVMRCGYSVSNNKAIIIDPEFHEITSLNPIQHSFTRLEHVKDVIIATYMPPTGAGLLVELVKPDGSVATKSCQTNLNNETIANCGDAQPMASAADIRDADQKIIPQCSDLLQQSKADIKPDLANPALAAAFKAGYQPKIEMLDAQQQTQQARQPQQQQVQ